MLRYIPNFITAANLFCGCVASVLVSLNQFEAAFMIVLLGIVFDLFDGLLARLLNVTSKLGLQLDSLADLITSGFVPGLVVYQLFLRSGVLVNHYKINLFYDEITISIAPIAMTSFIIPIGAAFRLAKFNVRDSKSDDFFGLPTPANAIFFCSLPLFIDHPSFTFISYYLKSAYVLIFLTLLFVFLMNSSWRLFSLKNNTGFEIKKLIYPILLILCSIPLILYFKSAAFPIIIFIYLLLSASRNWILFQS